MDKNTSQNADKQSLPHKTRRSSNSTTEPEATPLAEPGLLGRVAESATRLASSIARSTTQGGSTLNVDSLAEAKSEQQAESSTSMSQEWMAERSKHHTATSHASAGSQLLPGQRDTAATSFRQAMRSNASQSSHQVSLAENLDGQGVVEFLGSRMPTSISTGGISSIAPSEAVASPREKDEASEIKDPVAYLQSTCYTDSVDRRVPQAPQDNPAASQLAMGVSKSWDEHSASILEEWELNEAWDRAWMDTAWKSARKREKESAKPEAVQPTSKNLSYLLKPRI
ncbi:hypothetical protein LPJ78_003372 [Coemansia sp. RSA 989]|nr:hypothetical protein LPJ68_003561 [Coemansia sp. RSA 1086]KAJ1864418.1 hypothetical protein LPJ78_003372 [Coemansia sp. RSA 989]KAJ1871108.1 hypothetical protein LPJ55_004127 [Coemansia sp. RSA 990]